MMFRNREEAARLLAERLNIYKGRHPLVLAVPRGAVPMGYVIAKALGGELDVVLVHKLPAPFQPELAIGAIDESGHMYVSEMARKAGADDSYLAAEKEKQLDVLRRRRTSYTPLRAPIDPAGRTVIVVDNGIATGATMLAALRATRAKSPKTLIATVAVAPPETLARLSAEADELIYLDAPEGFFAVGQFFEDFSQVSDEEVVSILKRSTIDLAPSLADN